MTADDAPLSALDLVVDDPATATDTIEHALETTDAVEQSPELPAIHKRAAKHLSKQIAGQIKAVLGQLPVADMLVSGWGHLDKVKQAKADTLESGAQRTMSVGKHEIVLRHDPKIELVVGKVPVPLLHLLLDVVLTIDSSIVDVVAGEVTHVVVGPVAAKAMLTSNKVTLLERGTPKVDLRRLRSGNELGPIIEAAEPEPSAEGVRPTQSHLGF
ncbi:MAG: hypothetical protein JWM34_706 [Ilumatobacteraceae bacterium]|nr:hypothetical protein [Ilumatobacteraceae bacterium]